MDEATARAMIRDHFDASTITVAGDGPRDDIARASEIYADDALLEFPQGGERIRGKANILVMRSAYPARLDFQMHRTIGRETSGSTSTPSGTTRSRSTSRASWSFATTRSSASASTLASRESPRPGGHNGPSRWKSLKRPKRLGKLRRSPRRSDEPAITRRLMPP
jgi:hypothetical protein